jgi:hypothetical protein
MAGSSQANTQPRIVYRAVAVVVVILVVVGTTIYQWPKVRSAAEVAWQPLTVLDGQFRLLMPATPEQQQVPGLGAGRLFIAHVAPPLDMNFMAQFVDLDDEELELPLPRLAAGIVDEVLKRSPGSKRVAERDATLAGRPAREFEIHNPHEKITLILRLCVVGRIGVSLGAGGPHVQAADPLLLRYFDSFAVTGPVPERSARASPPERGKTRSPNRPPPKKADPEHVLVVISGVGDEATSRVIQDKLKTLLDVPMPKLQAVLSRKGTLTVRLEPVPDPQALAAKIDFGTVTKVQGRTIRVTANKP